MNWAISNRADPASRAIADRHYSRQKPGTRQFVPPGRCLVLRAPRAVWVTSWPFAEYVKHDWGGAWICSLFRNEGGTLSSQLITEAVAATVWRWPEPPALGMVTFVDRAATRPKKHPGYCYLRAGFEPVGRTSGGLHALQLTPDAMPPAAAPTGSTDRMFE